MKTSRIAELLQPFWGEQSEETALSNPVLESISIYIDILMKWNARLNLTAIRNEEEIVTRHFGESLFAARCLFAPDFILQRAPSSTTPSASQTPPASLADIGSGAGFPGLPIKLWAPNLLLTLVESNQKKCAFLREVVRSLELKNVSVEGVRAETLPEGNFDVVTMRAAEQFTSMLPVAARLVAAGGRLCLMIASSQLNELSPLAPAIAWQKPIPVPLSQSRIVLIGLSHSVSS